MDIALIEKEVPKVFVEAKRLDRHYDSDYMEQLAKYADYLDEEGIAVLTNGRYWLIHVVIDGDTRSLKHLLTIDIDEGDAETVAGELSNAIGRGTGGYPNTKPVASETITENLRKYRKHEAKRRNLPAYTILKDETINLIATQQPTDLRQLGDIKGVGPSTVSLFGLVSVQRPETTTCHGFNRGLFQEKQNWQHKSRIQKLQFEFSKF